MLGYSTLLLLVAGGRTVVRQRFWLLALGVFAVLGLGPVLAVAGRDTGLPLPYALLGELPILSMLRKPDRCMAVVQLCTAVLVAFAWRDVAGRLRPGWPRRAAWAGATALIAVETTGVPFSLYDYAPSPLVGALAGEPSIESVVELPAFAGSFYDGRTNLSQVHHGKKLPQGYTTSLALLPRHKRDGAALRQADRAPLPRRCRAAGRDPAHARHRRRGAAQDRAPHAPRRARASRARSGRPSSSCAATSSGSARPAAWSTCPSRPTPSKPGGRRWRPCSARPGGRTSGSPSSGVRAPLPRRW